MKALRNTTTTAAAIATVLVALAGTALAAAASDSQAVPATPLELEAHVVALGKLPGFWTVECPMGIRGPSAWAAGDPAEATVLRGEGFVTGLREPLRSSFGATGSSLGLRFRAAAGAAADVDRRERLAGHAGYATSFAVPGAPFVRAYTVRAPGLTTVHVGYARGVDEYALQVQVSGSRADVGALQRALAAAIVRVAGRG